MLLPSVHPRLIVALPHAPEPQSETSILPAPRVVRSLQALGWQLLPFHYRTVYTVCRAVHGSARAACGLSTAVPGTLIAVNITTVIHTRHTRSSVRASRCRSGAGLFKFRFDFVIAILAYAYYSSTVPGRCFGGNPNRSVCTRSPLFQEAQSHLGVTHQLMIA